MQDIDVFLKPTPTIDSDNKLIREKAEELSKGKSKDGEKAITIFYWVRDNIKYTPVVPMEVMETFSAGNTLRRGKGFCVEKAALLSALSRAAGIPARVHFADIRNHLVSEKLLSLMNTNLFAFHGYSELHIDGRWIKATPAFDLTMCQENGFRPVEFNARDDAIFHSHNLEGKLHIEYVNDRGYFSDVPVDDILSTWLEIYNPEVIEGVNKYLEEETGTEKT